MRLASITLLAVIISVVLSGCGKKSVSFKEQIQPVLNARCTRCHGSDVARGKIVMTSYATFMASHSVSGKEPLVVPGNPYQSRLYILCSTSQAHFRMPPDTSGITPLAPDELDLLRHWITEGAKDN